MLEMLEITISLVSIKKSWYQCHPPYTKLAISQRVLYLKLLWTYDICIICLHVRGVCLEIIIAVLYFCYSKNPLDVMKNIVDFIYIYFWKKKLLMSKYKKKTCYKENKSLYFWRHEKWPYFSFKSIIIFNMITDSFLVEKQETLERTKRCVEKWRNIWKVFFLLIFCKMFW